MSIWFVIFAITFFLIGGSAAIAGISAAPWLPTRKKDVAHLLEHVDVNPGEHVYELGSGSGTIILALAKKHPQAMFVGCEISILPYLISKLRLAISGMKNVEIRYQNLFKTPISDADVVFFYLLDKAYPKMIRKLASTPPHARIVVEAWPLKGIAHEKEVWPKDHIPYYFYSGSQFHNL